MALGFFARLLGKGKRGGFFSREAHYEKTRKKAASEDVSERRRLAGREDTEAEILYYLAEDPDTDVRRAIAGNQAAPRHADLLLARDGEGVVRSSLAEKIAGLAPGLSADDQDKVQAMTYEVLEILARDQMIRVREILSETLKDVADAPPQLIKRLAWDAELVVSGPVLERSPVLTDADLIEIIKSGPLSGALQAISRRDRVSEQVSDAIILVDDQEAVTALLGNASAQIREQTLDDLVERAGAVKSWHEPLVKRPALSTGAAERLAEFVANNLLDVLSTRKDLPDDVLYKVKEEVHRRLKGEDVKSEKKGGDSFSQELDGALKQAKSLYKRSKLSIASVTEAIGGGDKAFVMAALSVRAELPIDIVVKAIETESQKGIVAICWKAGFPVKIAVHLQRFLLHTLSGAVLGSVEETGYPLSEEEMTWQLEFFKDMA